MKDFVPWVLGAVIVGLFVAVMLNPELVVGLWIKIFVFLVFAALLFSLVSLVRR